ncbi:NAD(+)/NADH kinase [Halobacterium jilantaiense]|uniref:NAD(+)/NADH kinase n=1 Tax=Halobacterium jilantaiense TaxID=355548 RepID=UPI00115FD3AB|nr:NAD(+)/NADH kinase [Halobacterium jilantaiense]
MTTRVAVVGDDTGEATDAVRDAGGTVVDPADADVVAALGEDPLLDAAVDPPAPLLPVDAGREYGGVARADVEPALASLAAGDFSAVDRPTLAVDAPGVSARALADVTLATTEPAKISEFVVDAGDRRVDSVRADGVVAATPTGSRGYATDAGGPRLEPDVPAVGVVPISPFRVDRTNWVVAPPLSVTVARDETSVELHVDGRTHGTLAVDDPVALTWGEPLRVAVVPATRRPPRPD